MTRTKALVIVLVAASVAGLWTLARPQAPAGDTAGQVEAAAPVVDHGGDAAEPAARPDALAAVKTSFAQARGQRADRTQAPPKPVERVTVEQLPVDKQRDYYSHKLEAHRGIATRLEAAIARIEADDSVEPEARKSRSEPLRKRLRTEKDRIAEVAASLSKI